MDSKNTWTVELSTKATKQVNRLEQDHPKIYALTISLTKDIELNGPIRKNWTNFGSLNQKHGIPEDSYHCHLKNGRPTFVACWRIEDKKIKIFSFKSLLLSTCITTPNFPKDLSYFLPNPKKT